LLLAAFALVFTGCESHQMIKDSWKFTQRQYRAYLNTPASLDMEDKGSCEVYELALGEAVMNIDAELVKLIRAMENSDHNPDQNWVMGMFSRVPWLTGVALTDSQGNLEAQYPERFAKDFDITPLLEPDPKQRLGALRAYVQQHPTGPEVYVANPVYASGEMRGMIVAFFDPAALATMSMDPGAFVLASPVGVIWPGRYGGGPLAGIDWADLLTGKSCGLVGDGEGAFFWTTRYVGNLPLVYGMPVTAAPTLLPAPAAEAASAPAVPVEHQPAGAQSEQAAEAAPGTGRTAPEQAGAGPVRQDPWQGHEPGQNPAVMDAPGQGAQP
jgi:hypothetical protein